MVSFWLVCSNDGSFSADKITKLSIEMADLEPKVLAVKELRTKQAAVRELEEMIAEQTGETDPDAIELRVMAEDERRELLADIESLEATVTVCSSPRYLTSACMAYKLTVCTGYVLISTAPHAPA